MKEMNLRVQIENFQEVLFQKMIFPRKLKSADLAQILP